MARRPAARAPGGIEARSRRTGNPLLGAALLQMRRRSGWTQGRLELATRLSRGSLSLYETGKRPIARPLLDRLANSMGLSIEDVDRTLAALAGISAAEVQPPSSPASLLPHEHQAVEVSAERAARRAAEIVRRGVGIRLIEARLRSERNEAANLWEELRRLPTFRECLSRIHSDSRFRSWALCERLCEKSVSAAHHGVPASQGLARLALKIAERVPGGVRWFWAVLNVQGGRSSKSEAVAQLREIRQAFLLRNLELDANRVFQTIAELRQS